MNEKASLNQNARVLTNGRRLLAYVMDILTAFVLSLFVFLLVDSIGSSTTGMKNSSAEINTIKENLFSLVNDSKLDEEDDTGSLTGSAAISKRFIISSTLASLKRNNVSDISNSTYEGYTEITPETDNTYYYFVTFKEEQKSNYQDSDPDKDNYGLNYYRDLLIKNTNDSYYETSDYPYLTLETATSLDNYLRDDNYSVGKTIYDSLLAGYEELIKIGTNEYVTYYVPYLTVYKTYINQTNWIYKVKHIECLVSYLFAQVLVYLVAPLILKDGKTVTYKSMRIAVCTKNGMIPKISNYLIHLLCVCIENLVIIPLTFFSFYGTEAFGVLDVALIPGLSLIVLGVSSLIILLLSYIFCFVNKDTSQSISEFFSNLVLKDPREFVIERNMNDERQR